MCLPRAGLHSGTWPAPPLPQFSTGKIILREPSLVFSWKHRRDRVPTPSVTNVVCRNSAMKGFSGLF